MAFGGLITKHVAFKSSQVKTSASLGETPRGHIPCAEWAVACSRKQPLHKQIGA